MAPVAVVTDSTQYLPREVLDRHGIHAVSLYVTHDGRTEPETEITDYAAFYDRLRSARELPTTSQPSVGDFLAVYEPLLEQGADVLSIHLSGGISGSGS
jgi:DegV family protein with EDD domain